MISLWSLKFPLLTFKEGCQALLDWVVLISLLILIFCEKRKVQNHLPLRVLLQIPKLGWEEKSMVLPKKIPEP